MEKDWHSFIDSDVILYDLTRMVNRSCEPFATGIDRIDLAFAKSLMSHYGDRVVFVVRNGQDGAIFNREAAQQLLCKIEQQWLGQIRPPRNNLIVSLAVVRWLQNRIKNVVSVRPTIVSELQPLLEGRSATYIVASHSGLAKAPGLLVHLQTVFGLKVFVYIHDLIPIRYPEYIRPNQIGIFERFLDELRQVNARFFANSRHSAQDLELYGRQTGWPIEDVSVILPEMSPWIYGKNQPSLRSNSGSWDENPYFVTIGTIEPRKNHLTLLQCWRYWAQKHPDNVPHLYVIGQRGWENQDIIRFLESCPAILDHLTEHNDLDDRALRHLLERATALLLPSFAEGLGVPLKEATQLGVPSIVSDIPVFREEAGHMSQFVNPIDAMAWYKTCYALFVRDVTPSPK